MIEQSYTGSALAAPSRLSIGEQLEQEATMIRSRLVDLEAAIAALKGNPEIEAIINLVSKVQRF